MKALLTKLLTGRGGRIKAALAAILIGFATTAITKLGIELTLEQAQMTSLLAIAAAGWILESVAAKLGIDGVKEMQGVMQDANPFLKADGHAGKKTKETLVEILAEAGYYRTATESSDSTTILHTPKPRAGVF